jgi:murein DD-endopeptidase MepM/ murein hydrolase activator NlpD
VDLGKHPIRVDTVISSASIQTSVWVSMQRNNIDPLLALDLSEIYAWTIDFFGIQEGDKYVVEYEKRYVDTNYIGLGDVLSAKFTHSNHEYYAVLFTQDSLTDYFDEKGGSLRRTFLKAPLRFSRISSGYSNSRYHPVLKIRRPHHGVDYAAPRGTPIYSIGDGIVKEKRYAGGYGNMIMIKHNGTYSTRYAHLSKYASGLKVGQFVKQGEVIGYVGSTGLSTGPHLDFRFYKNGSPVNPLKVESPPALPVDSNHIDVYNKLLKEKMELLNNR